MLRRCVELFLAEHCFKIADQYVERAYKYKDKGCRCRDKAKKWFEKGCKFLNMNSEV